MSKLGDRTIMTLIVATAVLGFLGYALTILVYEPPAWFQVPAGLPWFLLPGAFAVFVIVILVVIWEGLDVLD